MSSGHPMIHDEFLLHRCEANPILTPRDFPGADGVRNCGQTMLGEETILLVSVDHRGDGYRGVPGRTTHVARNRDGIHFRIDPEPFFQMPPLKPSRSITHWISTRSIPG